MLSLMPIQVLETLAEMRALPKRRPRAVVMTMGALHDGHRALLQSARKWSGVDGELVVTVFVNPLQFAAGEDLDRYPRTWQQDLEMCEQEGVTAVFAPRADDMFSLGRDITLDPGPLGEILEGKARPDHFAGVLTVVAKFINLTNADAAIFGEKDYQQLALINRMVQQLEIPIEILSVPTIRDADGLALSSRNQYLTPQERQAAAVLPAALSAAVEVAAAGGGAEDAVVAAEKELAANELVVPDYVVVTDPLLGPAPEHGDARMLIAAAVGGTRLLDNAALHLETR